MFSLVKGKLAILRVFQKKTSAVSDKDQNIALSRQSQLKEDGFIDAADMLAEDIKDVEIATEFARLVREGGNEGMEYHLLTEGVNDPGIFKVVFVVAGPGAGKSYAIRQLGTQMLGLKYVASDEIFEYMMKKAGLSLDLTKSGGKYEPVRARAQKLTNSRQDKYIAGRLGIITETTMSNPQKTLNLAKMFTRLGYDTTLIYVHADIETALTRNENRARTVPEKIVKKLHKEVIGSLKTILGYFPTGATHCIRNNDGDQELFKQDLTKTYKNLKKWVAKAPRSAAAKQWIEAERKSKGR